MVPDSLPGRVGSRLGGADWGSVRRSSVGRGSAGWSTGDRGLTQPSGASTEGLGEGRVGEEGGLKRREGRGLASRVEANWAGFSSSRIRCSCKQHANWVHDGTLLQARGRCYTKKGGCSRSTKTPPGAGHTRERKIWKDQTGSYPVLAIFYVCVGG